MSQPRSAMSNWTTWNGEQYEHYAGIRTVSASNQTTGRPAHLNLSERLITSRASHNKICDLSEIIRPQGATCAGTREEGKHCRINRWLWSSRCKIVGETVWKWSTNWGRKSGKTSFECPIFWEECAGRNGKASPTGSYGEASLSYKCESRVCVLLSHHRWDSKFTLIL